MLIFKKSDCNLQINYRHKFCRSLHQRALIQYYGKVHETLVLAMNHDTAITCKNPLETSV